MAVLAELVAIGGAVMVYLLGRIDVRPTGPITTHIKPDEEGLADLNPASRRSLSRVHASAYNIYSLAFPGSPCSFLPAGHGVNHMPTHGVFSDLL